VVIGNCRVDCVWEQLDKELNLLTSTLPAVAHHGGVRRLPARPDAVAVGLVIVSGTSSTNMGLAVGIKI
jgi:hypothetical protein